MTHVLTLHIHVHVQYMYMYMYMYMLLVYNYISVQLHCTTSCSTSSDTNHFQLSYDNLACTCIMYSSTIVQYVVTVLYTRLCSMHVK